MVNEQLLVHMREELAKGVNRAQLIHSLLTAGWQVEDINTALNSITAPPARLSRSVLVIAGIVAIVGIAGFFAFSSRFVPTVMTDEITAVPEEQAAGEPVSTIVSRDNQQAPSLVQNSVPTKQTSPPLDRAPETTPMASNTWITQLEGNSVFLAKDDGTFNTGSVIAPAVTKKFFEFYPDQYDFIAIFTTYSSPWGSEYGYVVHNLAQGIGNPPQDQSAMYGSKGKLKGVSVIHNISPDTRAALLAHEMGHTWLVYLQNSLDLPLADGLHWSNWLDTGTREGGFLYRDPIGGDAYKDNGDGTFSLDNTPLAGSFNKFSSLSLYLMGFISASEMSPLALWIADSLPNETVRSVAGTKKTVTAQDIIKVAGARVPAYPNAQREFTIAYILLTKKGTTATNSQVESIKQFAQNFPKEWSRLTDERSTISLH